MHTIGEDTQIVSYSNEETQEAIYKYCVYRGNGTFTNPAKPSVFTSLLHSSKETLPSLTPIHNSLIHIAISATTAETRVITCLLVHIQNISSSNRALLHQLIHIIQLTEANNLERGIDKPAGVKVKGFGGILERSSQ